MRSDRWRCERIFGGLGLNFVATALTLWLIFGPWKRPGVGSMSGTEPFPPQYWLPTLPGARLSLWSVGLGVAAAVIIGILLSRTYAGLKLKAVGKNLKAAFLLGIPTWRYMLLAFCVCGLLAGLAGGLQVTGVYHRLIPSISSGYGFLGLLVAMLVRYRALWAAPVALFFAALNIGSIQLPITLKLDSSLAGVLQGVLVLAVILGEGARQRLLTRLDRGAAAAAAGAEPPPLPPLLNPARTPHSRRWKLHQREERSTVELNSVAVGLAGVLAASGPVVFAAIGETIT